MWPHPPCVQSARSQSTISPAMVSTIPTTESENDVWRRIIDAHKSVELDPRITQFDTFVAEGGGLAWVAKPGRSGAKELTTRLTKGGEVIEDKYVPKLDLLVTIEGNYPPSLTGVAGEISPPTNWSHDMLYSPVAGAPTAAQAEIYRHCTTGFRDASFMHKCLYEKGANPPYHKAVAAGKEAFDTWWSTAEQFGTLPPMPFKRVETEGEDDRILLRGKTKLVGNEFDANVTELDSQSVRYLQGETVPAAMVDFFNAPENVGVKKPRFIRTYDAAAAGTTNAEIPPAEQFEYHSSVLGKGSVAFVELQIMLYYNKHKKEPFGRSVCNSLRAVKTVPKSVGGGSTASIDYAAALRPQAIAVEAAQAIEETPSPKKRKSEPEDGPATKKRGRKAK